MDRDELLGRIKSALAKAFGERLEGVVLYGSEARGEAPPGSAIDPLVLVAQRVDCGRELGSAARQSAGESR
ncbi:MAG: hypothetical protein R6V58_15465 [Planctomycetota bacterium]